MAEGLGIYVLAATSNTQGLEHGDYSWTVEGELAVVPFNECRDPTCGCSWGWVGVSSRRATTTAEVCRRDDLGRATYRDLVIAHWDEQLPGVSLADDPTYVAEIDAFIDGVQRIGRLLGVGTVLRRRPDGVVTAMLPAG